MNKTYPLLDQINEVSDLKQLTLDQLPQLCQELREFLIYSISKSSGHFASNLGTIELTVALHYVYDSPSDKLLWDVGHQAYAHKVLTGRKEQIHTIRKYQGIHPFPWRKESEHDILSVGHSSTSISVACGLSLAQQSTGDLGDIIPIIGDGAMTAGMVFEALNHAGGGKLPMTIVFNDNNMSISPNQGAMNQHTDKIFNTEFYQAFRSKSKEVLPAPLRKLLKSTETTFKQLLSPSVANLFNALGVEYIGPIDGHNVKDLVRLFTRIKHNHKLQLVHIYTTKGKGYLPAEQDPVKFHGVGSFDPETEAQKVQANSSSTNTKTTTASKVSSAFNTATSITSTVVDSTAGTADTACVPEATDTATVPSEKPRSYSQVFGDWLISHKDDAQLITLTPAMGAGSGMSDFQKLAPSKFVDVAIAEQHCVTVATGLAIGGMKPVVAIYSTFLQRAYDQVIHDVALDNHNVLFAIDRAGIVGEDGQTHQGAFDLSYLRCIPNLVLTTPSSKYSLEQLLEYGYQYQGTFAVRYPRGNSITITQLLQELQQSLATTSMEAHVRVQVCQEVQRQLVAPVVLGQAVQVLQKNLQQYQHYLQSLALAMPSKFSKGIAIVSFGTMLKRAIKLAAITGASLYDMRFVKPLDTQVIATLGSYDLVVIMEENTCTGGAGAAVYEAMAAQDVFVPSLHIGIADRFIEPIDTSRIDQILGWDDASLQASLVHRLQQLATKL